MKSMVCNLKKLELDKVDTDRNAKKIANWAIYKENTINKV